MAADTVRMGVVGVGHMGQHHANILAGLAGVEFVGVVDTDGKRALEIAARHGVPCFDDTTQLLNKVDAICVAAPTNLHYRIANQALQSGVHVLVEKPMTRAVRFAERLVALAEEKGLILQTGHIERFNGAIKEIGNIVSSPRLVEARRLGPWTDRIKDVGVVLDLMVHDIDIVLGLVRSPLIEVNAVGSMIRSSHEDVASAVLRFENSCVANLTASRITNEKIRTLAISQDDAYIFLDYNRQGIDVHRRLSQDYALKREELRYSVETTVERVFVHNVNPLQQELMHFCDCVRGIAQPLVRGEDDVKTLSLTRRILECIHKDIEYDDEE
jgi:predicted dehydrogenase